MNAQPQRPLLPHWLKPLKTSRWPNRWVWLDCEAVSKRQQGSESQTFRLAVACFERRRSNQSEWLPPQWATFFDTESLWEWTASKVQRDERLIVATHGAGYDLRISKSFEHLPRLGFKLAKFSFAQDCAWVSWRGEKGSLIVMDTANWLKSRLGDIARQVGIERPKLPSQGDDVAKWLARCTADVEVMREAFTRVRTWIEQEDLGPFRLTGAGAAEAAYRRRFYGGSWLVHYDKPVREAERESAWAGRCEAWRWGDLGVGPWHEWDFTAAYASLCVDAEVPVRLVQMHPRRDLATYDRLRKQYAVLGLWEVTTDVPTVPTRVAEGIVWGVGTFRSWLWDCEVELARENGAALSPVELRCYVRRADLSEWARWVLSLVKAKPGDVDPMVRLVSKHWSRSLIGRFGTRWPQWEEYGPSQPGMPLLSSASGTGIGPGSQLFNDSSTVWLGGKPEDSPESVPQVMSYVMAATRVRIWRAMEAAGFENVVYVDTDSVIVSPAGHQRLLKARIPDLRVKGKYPTLTILGPRQLVIGGRPRIAGLPAEAVQLRKGEWACTVWRRLHQGLRQGESDRVVLSDRVVRFTGTDWRRAHRLDGTTYPRTIVQ